MDMNDAERIRAYAARIYIDPARRVGRSKVSFVSGNLHMALRYQKRLRAICTAIDARTFEEENGIKRVRRTGPSEGATVEWTFSL